MNNSDNEKSKTVVGGTKAHSEDDDDSSILLEGILSQIRNSVSQNKIKLWNPPFYEQGVGAIEEELLRLSETLAPTLDIDQLQVYDGLQRLQMNALDKLKAREELTASGKVTLKLKVSKSLRSKKIAGPDSISVASNSTGSELSSEVSKMLNCPAESLMLISSGHTIVDDKSLTEQNIKPGATVLIIRIDRSDHSWEVAEEQKRILETTTNDAKLLCDSDDLEIMNQDGVRIDLPKSENNALILAMSFHEKGRSAFRKGNHDLALVFFLEASKQYNACRADILKVVDNYGLLNLDIAWCYLHIGNVSELPNAEDRLLQCEKNFRDTYGTNLERLTSLKGSANTEAVLFLRLRLLKAVVAFHNGQRRLSEELLRSAEADLQRLDVPQDLIDEVVAQGFSVTEARLALRASGNSVPGAVRIAQETKEKQEKFEKEEAERKRKRDALGKTLNGSWVNLGYLKTIMEHGYDEKLAALALRQTDNDLDAAMVALTDDIETLLFVLTNEEVTPDKVSFVAENGFSPEKARKALDSCHGDVERAISQLNSGLESENVQPGTSQGAKRQKKETRQRMKDAISDKDDYLDLDLTEEKMYIDKYKKVLGLR